MQFMVRWLALASVAVGSTVASAQPKRIRVAVVPGIAVNLDTARVDALSQDLAQALGSELDVDAVGGLEVRRQLPPEGLPADCVTTPACTADVAKRTGATQLLFVVMVDSGSSGSIQIDTTWIDPYGGKTASRPAIDLTSPSEAKGKFTTAAPTLLPDAPLRTKASNGGNVGGVQTKMTEGVPRHFTTSAKLTAAIGGVGLGAGIAFGLATKSKYHKCEDAGLACTKDDETTIRVLAATADIGFLVAIGGAIATTVIYMKSSEQPHLVVAPTGDGGAAVTAFGRF